MDNYGKLMNDIIVNMKSPNKILKPLKKMIQMPEDELFNNEDFNNEDLGYLLKVIPYKTDDTKIQHIDNAIEVFEEQNPNILKEEDIKNLKEELYQIPFGKFHVILHSYKDSNKYFYIGVYCILHFIKNTKYVLAHLDDKQRYHHSRFKKDVLENYIRILEDIKSKVFFQSQSEFDMEKIKKKEKLLKIIDENYSVLIGYAHFMQSFGIKGMSADPSIDKLFVEISDLLNSIILTEKEVLKSLSVLLFYMLDTRMTPIDTEVTIENIMRIFFEKEIMQIKEKDTFEVNTKEYRGKNVYIHSTFDGISIYGINRKNKYFFYRRLKAKDIMFIQYKSLKIMFPNTPVPLSLYRLSRVQYKNPHIYNYYGVFSEFFTKKVINPISIARTFFSEAKKNAPDELLK